MRVRVVLRFCVVNDAVRREHVCRRNSHNYGKIAGNLRKPPNRMLHGGKITALKLRLRPCRSLKSGTGISNQFWGKSRLTPMRP